MQEVFALTRYINNGVYSTFDFFLAFFPRILFYKNSNRLIERKKLEYVSPNKKITLTIKGYNGNNSYVYELQNYLLIQSYILKYPSVLKE